MPPLVLPLRRLRNTSHGDVRHKWSRCRVNIVSTTQVGAGERADAVGPYSYTDHPRGADSSPPV